jgi:hypothetical protein
MYISLFNSNLNSICNPITHASVELIHKAFDFNEIQVTGFTTEKINNAIIFSLNEDNGKEVYSGFVKKVIPKNNTIELFGIDFKEFFNTEIILDYIANTPPITVSGMFDLIANYFRNSTDSTLKQIDFIITVPNDDTSIVELFGDNSGQILTINAYAYLLPYLKYFGYMIRARINWKLKRIEFTFSNYSTSHRIRLPDFVYDLQQTEPDTNKCIAMQKFSEFGYEWVKQTQQLVWRDSDPLQKTWSETEPMTNYDHLKYVQTGESRIKSYEWKLQVDLNAHLETYNPFPDTYCKSGYVYRMGLCVPIANWQDVSPLQKQWSLTQPSADSGERWTQTGNKITEYEWKLQQRVNDWVTVDPEILQWATTEPVESDTSFRWVQTGRTQAPIGSIRYYYLDTLNNIVESDEYGNIPNRYYPVKNKVISDEYLANAQYQAILELCNSRYVDNIYIDTNSPINPIDLSNLELLDMVEVYDSAFNKTLPVSEKILTVDEDGEHYRIKLGFKKDKLTEIIKAI